ncbi:MAG: hypothetical protein CVU91_13345 [Firmicutes bacterium HGW-Firmicutes-16]|nr:MAG: hypothetical protein CVU91_13345 [Firmicutes bacterium HGW-Firmicutes-16]
MKKRILSIILVLVLVAALLPSFSLPAQAAVIDANNATALKNAVSDAQNGDTVKLTANIDMGANCLVINTTKGIILDLNGHVLNKNTYSLSSDAIFELSNAGGSVTVRDSSVGGNGEMIGSGRVFLNRGNGAINIESGLFTSSGGYDAVISNYDWGPVNISGGTVSGLGVGAIYNNLRGKITISGTANVTSTGGSTIYIPSSGSSSTDPVIEITGGTLSNTNAGGKAIEKIESGAIVVSGGNVSGSTGIYALGSQVIVSGGSISNMTLEYYATLKNTTGTNLEKYTLTMQGKPNTLVSALSLPNSYAYGMNNVFTNTSSEIYVWLPANQTGLVTANVGGTTYYGIIAANAATLTTTVIKPEITASLSAPGSLTYDGNPKTYTANITGGTLTLGTHYNIRYTGEGYDNTTAPTNAGSYTATFELTAAGQASYSITTPPSVGFTIAKATPATGDLTSNVSTPVTYNGTPQAVSVTSSKTGIGTITVKYNGSTTVPTNAGSYSITVDISSGTNYNAVTSLSLGTYIINKATPTLTPPTAIAAFNYGVTLTDGMLSGGTAKNPIDSALTVPGSWRFTTQNQVPSVGTTSASVTFTPTDTVNYNSNTTAVEFAVAKAAQSTPNAPASSGTRTSGSITVTSVVGQMYFCQLAGSAIPTSGITGWTQATGNTLTFTSLSPDQRYDIYTYIPADTNHNESAVSAALTTKKAPPAAPTLAFDSITANSVTITAITGAEYSKDNGATWQDDNSFSPLTAATQYTFAIRIKETADTEAGIETSLSQYTAAATPAGGVGYSINYSTEKITVNSGYEVSTDATFSTTITSVAPINPSTTYYLRVAAVSGGAPASDYAQFTLPARPAAPTGITADKTKNSITVTTVEGQEYKINSGDWQVGGSFASLTPNTPYTVYTRVKATGTAFASADYSVSVTTKAVGSVATPTPDAVTYDPTKTLADTTLPAGWDWSSDATVPTVAISGYSAVYTPTDTATVDYSGEAGYANTSGTVTITRTIALTVNRATPTAADFTYAAPLSLDYSGTDKTATVTANGGISGMGAVTVKYYLGAVETTPTNVATYTVKIDIAQGANYAAATDITDDAWTFTIAKVAQDSLSITEKPASIIYGDTFTLATTGGSSSNAVTWAVTAGTSADVNESTGVVTITGVGETTITATKAADGNYSADVTDTYTFTPAKRLITVAAPSATGGWTKTYDGVASFNTSAITVGSITNKVGADVVTVSAQNATYDTADIGSNDKTLTITYAIDGAASGNYSSPNNTVISTASVTAATPTITLVNNTAVYTDKKVEIAAATVTGVMGGTTPDGAVTYTYYTKDTCTDADKTTVDKSGAEAVGGAPKNAGTYYVKATIAASGNYTSATSAEVTLTIYYPSSGADKSSAPVIVDGKTVDMGSSEVKDGTTTVKVDQSRMTEQLKNAKDSVVIPITSKTDTTSAQLVIQNVESMNEHGVSLTIIAGDVSYSIPSGAIDTSAALKELGASDSSKVPLNISISKLSNSSVTIQNGTLMVPPVAFTVTATYNGKSVAVDRFGSYVQRVIEIPDGVDPKTITTAVVVDAGGTQRHVPTKVYSENGKWYASINAMTNSTYALIQNSVSFTDTAGKWYDASVTEMASREIISGIGENMFAGERAITRAEFAAIIVRALGLPTTGTSAFADVASNAWYNGAVGTAFEYGVVSGVGNNKFNPDANITRQDAMVMMERAGKMAGLNSGKTAILVFSDFNEAASYALSAVNYNTAEGLVKGSDGKLNPKANITRAETATVVLRLLQKAGLVDVRAIA